MNLFTNSFRLVSWALLLAIHSSSDAVRLTHDERNREFTVELGPVNLAAAAATTGHEHHTGGSEHSHGASPVEPFGRVRIPVDGYINGFSIQITDAEGREVPRDIIHHLNFIDPARRELFAPISQRILAVGKETEDYSFPTLLFGLPVEAGTDLVVTAMLHNPHARAFSDVTVRVTFSYSPPRRPWPLFRVYPFQMDVLFPHGDKSFDLPPGQTVRSYESTPAIDGRIVAISGHVHERASYIRFSEAVSGKVLWEGKPVIDSSGVVKRMPVTSFAGRMGVKLRKGTRYRVSVAYENPTADTILAGGMGVVGGLFLPAGRSGWPLADSSNPVYSLDRAHYMRENASGG